MLTTTHDDHGHHYLRVGDRVTICRDVLAELGRMTAGLPPTWFCVPAGTPGRLIGWRDARAVIDLDETLQRLVVFVGERHLVRALRLPEEPPRVKLPAPGPATRRTSYRSRRRS